MKVQRIASAAFLVELESEHEVREEHRLNLSFGALRLPTGEKVAEGALLLLTLRGPGGGTIAAQARVAAMLPDGIALAVEGDADAMLARLLEAPAPVVAAEPAEEEAAGAPEKSQSAWDRIRALSQMEKILLASKADRTERALLLQDNDPRVLLSVLRNPRLTVEEVVRVAKSPFLTFQIAELLLQTTQWMASLDVRLGLVHNPKTPQAFALRILPTLPESEVRAIARAGTSMALKQAALRRLQGRG